MIDMGNNNTDNRKLSFPERNWLLLCILVAIISPIFVDFVRIGARRETYKQSVDIRYHDTGSKVAVPPGSDAGKKPAQPDSAKH
jgi:hypothetical protein